MAKYVVIYTGGGGMAAAPAEQQKIMAEWGAWYGKIGPAVVDGGNPFGGSKHLVEQGQVKAGPLGANAPTGYTIISADSLEAAAEQCKDHPHLNHGGQVQIFQAIEMG